MTRLRETLTVSDTRTRLAVMEEILALGAMVGSLETSHATSTVLAAVGTIALADSLRRVMLPILQSSTHENQLETSPADEL